MSGSSFLDSFFEKNRLAFAKKQSALLNCPTYTSQEIKDCLMKKGAQEIASSLNRLAEWGPEPVTTYIPVIEPDVIAERFLEADPTELFLSGKFAKVPLITGITKDGVSHKALSVILNSSLAEDMDNNFDTVAPIAFFYERNTERSHIISQELRKFYLKGQHLTNTSLSDLGELFTDAIIGFPEDRASTVISHLSGAPLYYYKFSYQGRYSSVYRPHTNIPYGMF
ncbi:hypothetical protein B7P43_G07079 [Cryptotermes secundus]|uniref:Carboxylesterase type B domain-containing protein n=1 Tax=Cryptotermes secundus TaxID=105785 RepID=A0A2J7PD55_9NEOP|nr:hypothetical protein B7P43_G07079 [Cryptotermes secundus]